MGNCQRGETGTLLCPGAQCETDSKDAHHEEKRVGFRPCQREFDEKQNSKRDAEENTVIPSEADCAVERARTEIDRDRADYTDCIQAGQGLEICCGHQHDNRKTDRDEQRLLHGLGGNLERLHDESDDEDGDRDGAGEGLEGAEDGVEVGLGGR